MELTYGTVKGTFDDILPTENVSITGHLTFTPEARWILTDDKIILPTPKKAVLKDRAFEVELLATDDPTLNPVDWTYRIDYSVQIDGVKHGMNPINIRVPGGVVTDLATATPVAGSSGNAVVRGPEGPQGLQGTQGLKGDTGARGLQGIQGLTGLTGSTGPKGDKGEPGGYAITTLSDANTDPDTLRVSGLYRYLSSAGAHTAKLPKGEVGILEVLDRTNGVGNRIFQEYNVQAAGGPAKVFYRRFFDGGSWSAWEAFTSSRISETAGRALYVWDATNNREQLVYGDTGWRQVPVDDIPGISGTLRMRRTTHTVQVTGDIFNTGTVGDKVLTVLPAGFKSTSYARLGVALTTGGEQVRMVSLGMNSSDFRILSMPLTTMYFSVTYSTTNVWPTSLPGTPIDVIPSL